ncbi:MAG: hypothetical protein JOS17DRAFT_767132 [Linnemannia elongata]|nr:MAG: hypothetical protein JOS17DRAFT_767132 [Linnemannia elongata]
MARQCGLFTHLFFYSIVHTYSFCLLSYELHWTKRQDREAKDVQQDMDVNRAVIIESTNTNDKLRPVRRRQKSQSRKRRTKPRHNNRHQTQEEEEKDKK